MLRSSVSRLVRNESMRLSSGSASAGATTGPSDMGHLVLARPGSSSCATDSGPLHLCMMSLAVTTPGRWDRPVEGGGDVLGVRAGTGDRLLAWLDAQQRRLVVLGFPYAVVMKYVDDGGGRHAALITYYGFLSIFPILLVATSVVSRVLVEPADAARGHGRSAAPPALQSTVNTALAAMPTSGLPLGLGIAGLLFSGTGVVFSAYETLNQLAGVPTPFSLPLGRRATRRVVLMVVVVLVGGLGVAALTVALRAGCPTSCNGLPPALATALVVFVVLVTAAALLVARPVRWRTSMVPAATGAVVVTLVLALGARLLAPLVARAGPVYGSFATVAGIFTLLYLVSQALLYAAEVAVVRHRGLWPRALVTSRPTPADILALTLLASVQERIPLAAGRGRVRPSRPEEAARPTVASRSDIHPDPRRPRRMTPRPALSATVDTPGRRLSTRCAGDELT